MGFVDFYVKHNLLQSIEEGNRKDWYRHMYRTLHKTDKKGTVNCL